MIRFNERAMFPKQVIDFLPKRATIGAEKKLAISWTMFAIKGMYKEMAGLYLTNTTPISVMIILIPLNCCMKWSSNPKAKALQVTTGSSWGTGSCSLWWSDRIFCTAGSIPFYFWYISIVLLYICCYFAESFLAPGARTSGSFIPFCSAGSSSLHEVY